MKQHLSECCAAEIVKVREYDPYPLGRGEYNGAGITYLTDVCSKCGDECEDVELFVCDDCGEISDIEKDICTKCEVVTI